VLDGVHGHAAKTDVRHVRDARHRVRRADLHRIVPRRPTTLADSTIGHVEHDEPPRVLISQENAAEVSGG